MTGKVRARSLALYKAMSTAAYQRVASASPPREGSTEVENPERPQEASTVAAFNEPPPAWWKRAGLVIAIAVMFWATFKLGAMGTASKPEVIYASRYSDEFKYRPAASPVITEYLKDGRIRLRGATPGGVGIRPGDLPKTPKQIEEERAKAAEDARIAARKKLGLKVKEESKGYQRRLARKKQKAAREAELQWQEDKAEYKRKKNGM